jgi:hypothetical protein
MSDTKLTKAEKRQVAAVKAAERTVIRRARRVVEQGALDATALNDDGLPVEEGVTEGWSARRRNVANDMRKAKRAAPVYIDVLARQLESHDKIEAAKTSGAAINLNIGAINIVKAPEYPVIDVTTVEGDGE